MSCLTAVPQIEHGKCGDDKNVARCAEANAVLVTSDSIRRVLREYLINEPKPSKTKESMQDEWLPLVKEI